ncbi:MAG: response regulator [Hyphomicrobiales bacterium]
MTTALPIFVIVAVIAAMAAAIWLGRKGQRAYFRRNPLESLPEACAICDPRGRVMSCNRRYRELVAMAGLPRLVGVESLYAGYGDITPCVYRLTLAARQAIAAEEVISLPPGSPAAGAERDREKWLRISVSPVKQARKGEPAVVLWRIAQIGGDKAVRQARDRLHPLAGLIDHAPFGFFCADEDGNIDHINATLAEWLGIDRAEVGKSAIAVKDILNDAPERIMGDDATNGAAEAIWTADFELKTRDGGKYPVHAIYRLDHGEGERRGLSCLLVAREAARTGGKASDETVQSGLSRLVGDTAIGIAEVDETGRIGRANAAFARLLGKSAMQNALLGNLVDARQRLDVERALEKTRDGQIVPAVDASLAGDENRTAQLFFSPEENLSSVSGRFIVHAVETTAQRSLEIQFAQSQKMQAVGQLAGGMAHDFNNILTAIIGFSDLLLTRHKPADPSFRDMMNIKQSANRAANLVRQLLAFSRRQTLLPEILSLSDVLSDLGHLLGRLIGEKIELRITYQRDLWPVKADVNQFEQVIVNLVVNARDAMPGGGRLTIRTANVTIGDGEGHKSAIAPPGDYVLCEIADSGTGMPQDVVDKMYEPFFSTKDVGKGTGLGLSTVYGIIRQTGGLIFCDSKIGKGTTFRIYLPRYRPEMTEPVRAREDRRETEPTDLTGKGTILLVEDEEAVRMFAVRALSQRGYTVLGAECGTAALKRIDEHDGPIDLVISDVIMPEMDGPALLRALRQKDVAAKMIFISGYAEEAFSKDLSDSDPFGFLPKPFTLKQLAAAVKQALGR